MERTLNGTSGTTTVFNFWELVETYRICDAAGSSYSDPNFEVLLFEVKPGSADLRVKDVLTQIFSVRTIH